MLNKMKPTLALATLPTVPVVTAVFRIAGLIQTPRTFWNNEFNGLLPYFRHHHLWTTPHCRYIDTWDRGGFAVI